MKSRNLGKEYTPKFKFQVVLDVLKADRQMGQIAKAYGVHPVTVSHWKSEFLEKGAEAFGQRGALDEYERKIGTGAIDRAQGGGNRTFKKLLGRELTREEKIGLIERHKDEFGLNRLLRILKVAKKDSVER